MINFIIIMILYIILKFETEKHYAIHFNKEISEDKKLKFYIIFIFKC